jgi:hypothetical protein
MTIKNNDDVAHLLDATGRTGTPYREFESSADQMSAPLIDAIFGKDAPLAGPEDVPLAIAQAPGHDLLADVFDRAPATGPLPGVDRGGDRGMDRGGWLGPALAPAPRPTPVLPARAPAAASVGAARSLDDIRRIITHPADQVATPASNDSLNGLFDRLAR